MPIKPASFTFVRLINHAQQLRKSVLRRAEHSVDQILAYA
jgi:hypothetical protein